MKISFHADRLLEEIEGLKIQINNLTPHTRGLITLADVRQVISDCFQITGKLPKAVIMGYKDYSNFKSVIFDVLRIQEYHPQTKNLMFDTVEIKMNRKISGVYAEHV